MADHLNLHLAVTQLVDLCAELGVLQRVVQELAKVVQLQPPHVAHDSTCSGLAIRAGLLRE